MGAQDLNNNDEKIQKKTYLEARLGSKALVTGKLGVGASSRVYALSSLQFKSCLKDIKQWSKTKVYDEMKSKQEKRTIIDNCDELIEAYANIVEFDGLETTLDPSPRPELTLQMYNDNKRIFVKRLLMERIIPITNQIIQYFGTDIKIQCEKYVRTY